MIRSPIARTGMLKPARTRKCAVKGCANRFQPRNMMHKVCGAECAAVHAVAERKRLAARQDRELKVERMDRGAWLEAAQKAFNAFIRFRDRDQPCICCGKFFDEKDRLTGGQWDAGHYLSRGSAPHLRFVELNVHKQLKGHNRPGGTTRAAFREGMIERIGLAAVEALEADQAPRMYTIDDLKRIKAEYSAKLKQLKKEAA
jgi:6-phosphofructokinase